MIPAASRLLRHAAVVASLASCATRIESRAAADYTGQPVRVAIVPEYIAFLNPRVSQRFLDELAGSLETCGVTPVMMPPAADEEDASAGADAEVLIRSVSRTVGGIPRAVQSETFEVLFVDTREHRIVWRGAFPVDNDDLFLHAPGQAAHDLVARLSHDKILKRCP